MGKYVFASLVIVLVFLAGYFYFDYNKRVFDLRY